jgi:ankyrin repeat protein
VAIHLGRVDIVKLLVDSLTIDLDLSSNSQYGLTPLTMSSITGNYEIMKLLLEKGAEVNKPTLFSYTAFTLCF